MEPAMFREISEKIEEQNLAPEKITIDGDCTLPLIIQENNENFDTNAAIKLDRAHFMKNLSKNILKQIKSHSLTKEEKYHITDP